MSDVDFHIMLNGGSGTAHAAGVTAEQIVGQFAALGHRVSIDADSSKPFAQRLRAAGNSTAPVLVAAGGDGTATALAKVASETGKRLAVLPLGTANLLARDLNLPLELDQWFAALPDMVEREIDFGEVNGQVFLHKVVIGAVPGIAAVREKIRGNSSWGARLGFMTHFFRALSRVRRFAAEITTGDGEPTIHRVHSIAVANNDYAAGLGKVFTRTRLDAGFLSLYIVTSLSPGDAIRLGLEMLLGTWRQDGALEIENVRSVTIRTRRRRVRAMIDGEVGMIDGPFDFRIHPLGLKVLAGPVAAEASEAQPLEATG
ncbi:MAG: diacylglycerol kinase family protein [Devosia sp.]|nr:diacylglycerol kinase family protein [Devosia sp.]